MRRREIRRLIINLPPRHAKSLLASVAFPAWCLGHEPSLQILCASYAQELADKLSRDCRRIVASHWYRRVFPTRLSAARQAMAEFDTTAQGCRLATSVGGVLTGRGADRLLAHENYEVCILFRAMLPMDNHCVNNTSHALPWMPKRKKSGSRWSGRSR